MVVTEKRRKRHEHQVCSFGIGDSCGIFGLRPGRIGMDVTPRSQLEINKQNDLKNAKRRSVAESQREQAERRAAELRRQVLQAQ